MKIFYAITKSEAGGAQTHVFQLSRHFISQGHEVIIMSSSGGWLEKKVLEIGARFIPNRFFSNAVNPINCFRAMAEIRRVVLEEKPDILHAHSSAAGFYARVAVKNKVPTIYTAHGWGFNIGVPFWQKYLAILGEKIGADFCKKIICVSEFVKNLGLKYHVAPEDKFVVVHNGVEDITEIPHTVNHHELLRMIFVGRLAAPKLPNLLLQAVAEMPDDLIKKLSVTIVGGGEEDKKEMLKNYAREMRLQNVKICGDTARREVMNLLLSSDVFVLLSRWEGLPLTILEAMSAGLPVIASRVGGISEAVDEQNGVLVENNIEDVKMAIAKMINDPEHRRIMGEKSRQKVREKFLLDSMLSKTEKIYKDLIE